MKVRLLTQSSGLVVAVGRAIVGSRVVCRMPVGVGWRMRVGSISGTGAVGGTNEVGSEAGEQAQAIIKTDRKQSSLRPGMRRSIS